MRAFSNMPSADFIAQLRQAAIAAKLGPLVIDQIDQLGDVESLKADLATRDEELDAMTEDRNDLRRELHDLLVATDPGAMRILSDTHRAIYALERHGLNAGTVVELKFAYGLK